MLSPGTGLSCPRHFRELCPRKLSASVGAPGPHDFAVRDRDARLASLPRPPHPASYVRDDRDTPLLWRRDSGKNTQFLLFRKRNISARRTENPDQTESARKIRFYVTSNSELTDLMRCANQAKILRLIARRANQTATATGCRAALVSLARGPVVLPSSSTEHVDGRRRTLLSSADPGSNRRRP